MAKSIKTMWGPRSDCIVIKDMRDNISWGYEDMRSAGESDMDSWVVPKEDQLFTLEDYCDYMMFREQKILQFAQEVRDEKYQTDFYKICQEDMREAWREEKQLADGLVNTLQEIAHGYKPKEGMDVARPMYSMSEVKLMAEIALESYRKARGK